MSEEECVSPSKSPASKADKKKEALRRKKEEQRARARERSTPATSPSSTIGDKNTDKEDDSKDSTSEKKDASTAAASKEGEGSASDTDEEDVVLPRSPATELEYKGNDDDKLRVSTPSALPVSLKVPREEGDTKAQSPAAQSPTSLAMGDKRNVIFTWPEPFDETPSGDWILEGAPVAPVTDIDTIASNGVRDHVLQHGALRIHVSTWNQHAKDPPSDISSLLNRKHHIYSVATQECVHTIAQSVVYRDKSGWEQRVTNTLGDDYVKLRSHTLQAIHLMVMVHRSLLPLISEINSCSVAAGIGDRLGNKGGVVICFKIGLTSFAFVGSHFQAEQNSVKHRNDDFHRISKSAPKLLDGVNYKEGQNIIDMFDMVFWSGDLNYRINGLRRVIDKLIERNMHEVMINNDQLSIARKAKDVFEGYEEGPVLFKPTYKFDKGCHTYDTSSKQRIPSWTDRILYKPSTNLRLCVYNSARKLTTSDHLPVFAVFDNKVQFKSTTVGKEVPLVEYGGSVSEVCTVQ